MAGYKNAIEYYEMSALECLFLPDEFKLQEKLKFKIDRFCITDRWHRLFNSRCAKRFCGFD